MAGDWLKFELATLDKPEVIRMGRQLGMSKEAVCGWLIRFWGWCSANSVDGVVDGVTSTDVDVVLSLPGFAESLKAVGWLIEDTSKRQLVVPHFDYHNSESAKKRALRARRQKKWRDAHVDTSASTGASTREEKRREYKTPIPPSADFEQFWGLWPSHERKQSKGKCWEAWKKAGLDICAGAVLSHVESLKASEGWRRDNGSFIPAPLVYLNQRRWEGAEPLPGRPLKVAL